MNLYTWGQKRCMKNACLHQIPRWKRATDCAMRLHVNRHCSNSSIVCPLSITCISLAIEKRGLTESPNLPCIRAWLRMCKISSHFEYNYIFQSTGLVQHTVRFASTIYRFAILMLTICPFPFCFQCRSVLLFYHSVLPFYHFICPFKSHVQATERAGTVGECLKIHTVSSAAQQFWRSRSHPFLFEPALGVDAALAADLRLKFIYLHAY